MSSRLALEDYLSSEQEEQAMTVIAAAQDVKARKRSWQDTEDEIISSGQAACYVVPPADISSLTIVAGRIMYAPYLFQKN